MTTHKGLFKPAHPEKYAGDPNQIIYRSGWEFKYMMQLDHDPNVVRWASEEFSINYLSPIDKKVHRYFVDFLVEYRNGIKEMIEIKPFSQCIPPKANTKRRNQRKLLNEMKTFEVNQAKWAAAKKFCKERNIKFKVLTEKELFPKVKR